MVEDPIGVIVGPDMAMDTPAALSPDQVDVILRKISATAT